MATIFLAHAAADRERARALTAGLHSAGHTVRPATPPAGDQGWWAGLLAAAQEADVFLYATTPAAAGGVTGLGGAPSAGGPSSVSLVVGALRDYAVALGLPTLEIHLSGAGRATGFDYRWPTADAAFSLVGAIAAVSGRPAVMGWQAPPESPFARRPDLARDLQAPTLGDQRALVDRLRLAADDPAVQELAVVLRLRTELEPENARLLDESFPANARILQEAGLGSLLSAEPGPPDAPDAHASPFGSPWPTQTRDAGAPSLGAATQVWRPPAGGLTPDDVRSIAFRKAPFGRRGYDEEQVDLFLDKVEADLRIRYAGGPVVQVRLTAADVQEVTFMRPPRGKRGYNEEEVDTFLEEIQRTVVSLDHALAEHGITVSKH